MGEYRGRKQSGRIFAILRQYFIGVPINSVVQRKEILPSLLAEYQRQYPELGVDNITGLDDGLRCLASLTDSPIKRIGQGQYCLIRSFEKKDSSAFNRIYDTHFAKKGGKYNAMKEQERQTLLNSQTKGLTKLGDHGTKYQYENPSVDILETFPNPYPNRQYITEFKFAEFTSLCPKTGQPDFATITVRYVPKRKCIETKSLKIYFLTFRQYGAFMERIVNQILDDLVEACAPIRMQVTGEFNTRGGTRINVEAEYEAN